jgi:hypothetical protein
MSQWMAEIFPLGQRNAELENVRVFESWFVDILPLTNEFFYVFGQTGPDKPI